MANSTYPGMNPQKPPGGRRANRTADTKQEPSAAQPRQKKEQSEPGHGKSPRQDSDGETRRVKPTLETLESNRCHHITCGAYFDSAEQLNRHKATGHPDIPERKEEVCRWSRCGKTYFSLYYWRQHCEKKCRFLNDIDHGPPRKSKNSLLTVSQGDDRAADGQARQTNKRKISGTKPPRGGKKTQNSRKRSPSPPSPTFVHSFTSVERASSPEEDQFVTSRRPSSASIIPEAVEDTSTALPLAYPAYLENLDHPSTLSNGSASFTPASIHLHDHPQHSTQHMFSIPQDEQHAPYAPYNSGVGHYPHLHAAYPGPPPGSTYLYDSRVAPYGSLPSYDANTHLPAFVSGPPVHEAPVIFNLDPF